MGKDTDGNKIASYMMNAASKLREVGRNVVYAIIATSWAISYSKDGFYPSFYIKLSLVLAICYVVLDLLYYLLSAILYKYYLKKYFKPGMDDDFHYIDIRLEDEVTKGTCRWMEIGQWWMILMAVLMLASALFMIYSIKLL